LNDLEGAGSGEIEWQSEDGNGLGDGFTWVTSREFLIKTGLCTTSDCFAYATTSSIEMLWIDLTYSEAEAKRDSITDMELHLSDEARGLGDIPIDDP
jgi:hypothetical protein